MNVCISGVDEQIGLGRYGAEQVAFNFNGFRKWQAFCCQRMFSAGIAEAFDQRGQFSLQVNNFY